MYYEFYLSFSVTGMSPLSPYLNVDPRYLVQVSFCNTTDNVTFQAHLKKTQFCGKSESVLWIVKLMIELRGLMNWNKVYAVTIYIYCWLIYDKN